MKKHGYQSGPWEAYRTLYGEYVIKAPGSNGDLELATVHNEAEYGPLAVEDNAKLIAQAPELHAILFDFYTTYKNQPGQLGNGGAFRAWLAAKALFEKD